MRILLVEDNVEVSGIAIEFVGELGHEATAVSSAEDALTELALDARYDAVMTDVRLPGMSGIALAKQLHVKYPSLPVIISSGYGSLDLELVLGPNPRGIYVLPKPYELAGLAEILQLAAAFQP